MKMGWTHWKRLANSEEWYPDVLDYDGPACYELGIRGKWKHYVIVTYAENTGNLSDRMYQYARNGSHLKKIVTKYWKYDYTLWFRYMRADSKQRAMALEKNRLKEFRL